MFKGKNSNISDQCLRMLYGTDLTRNACHGSDSIISASKELDFFFPLTETLGLIKPDVVAANKVDEVINDIIDNKFRILEIKSEQLTKERAEEFYAEHKVNYLSIIISILSLHSYLLRIYSG